MKTKTLIILFTLLLSSAVLADEHEEVMALLERYAELEGDLNAQEKLIRSDRVQIAPTRWTDNAAYMEWQKRDRAHRQALSGAGAEWLVQIESPEVRVYGTTAVASFIRRQMIMPPDAAPIAADPLYQTVVLVKEDGAWGIAHTHVSPVGRWN